MNSLIRLSRSRQGYWTPPFLLEIQFCVHVFICMSIQFNFCSFWWSYMVNELKRRPYTTVTLVTDTQIEESV